MRGKAIQIHLLSGNPKGSKHIYFPVSKVIQAFYIPRVDFSLPEIQKREELKQPAVYFLLGEDNQSAYIGETENFFKRIKQHIDKKDFWDNVLCFVAADNGLTKADVKYLEYKSIVEAKNKERVNLDENSVVPTRPNLSFAQEDVMEDFFEDIKLLSSFLNINWFDKKFNKDNLKQDSLKQDNMFFLTSEKKHSDAQAIYDQETKILTVLKGSKVSKEKAPSSILPSRDVLIDPKVALDKGEYYELLQNKEFDSPSGASKFVLGHGSNGWRAWKNEEGEKLENIFRFPTDEDATNEE